MTEKKENTEKIPSTLAFERFLDYIHHISQLLHICMKGLRQTSGYPPLVKAITNYNQIDKKRAASAEDLKKIKAAEDDVAFASVEIDAGFPTLHAHSVVSLWAALETLIQDLFVARLKEDPAILKCESFSKIRIPLVDFEAMDHEDRMETLFNLVQRDAKVGLREGITQYEDILKLVGLPGTVDAVTRKMIFEFQQVRNLIAHKGGVVDQKFLKACPWIASKKGERLTVSHKQFEAYAGAVSKYVINLMERGVLARNGPAAAATFRTSLAKKSEERAN